MLDKQDIRNLTNNAVGFLGSQLRSLRLARGLKISAVGRATGLSFDEIDGIENWNLNTLNLENVIKLAAFYNKKLFLDFYTIEERV